MEHQERINPSTLLSSAKDFGIAYPICSRPMCATSVAISLGLVNSNE